MLFTLAFAATLLTCSAFSPASNQLPTSLRGEALPRRLWGGAPPPPPPPSTFCLQCSDHGNRPWYYHWWVSCTCDPGFLGACCDDTSFKLKRIRNDNVENELMYYGNCHSGQSNCREAANFPDGLKGIFWMDQRGVSLPNARDPDYQQVGNTAADEILVSFGEALYNPKTRCVGPVPVYGGERGHWTMMDQTGAGDSDTHAGALHLQLTGDFCFSSDELDHLDLSLRVYAGNVLETLSGTNLPEVLDGYITVPQSIIHLTMEKTKFGWDRVTMLGPEFLRCSPAVQAAWRQILPAEYHAMLDATQVSYHYPVFQVVDADGQRTENYEAYLDWANTQTASSYDGPSDFEHALNRGAGSQLVGVVA